MSAQKWFMPLFFILLTLSGCSDHDDTPAIVFTELQVTASENPIPAGFESKLTATGFYSDGSSHNIDATWVSLDESKATVDNYGTVTALSPGEVTIQAETPEGTGMFLLTVTDATITSIRLEPLFAEVPVGHNIPYNAEGYFSDGTHHNINNHANLTWVSEYPEVAIINTETDKSDTKTEGVTTFTAVLSANPDVTQDEITSNSVQMTVTSPVLQTITISPDSVNLAIGLTQQFKADGLFSNGTFLDISGDVIWTSTESGILELMLDEEEYGVFKGIALGKSNVSATYNEISSDNQALFVVEQKELTSFTVYSPSSSDSQPLGREVQFEAVVVFNNGDDTNISGYKQVHWQSSAPEIATVTLSGLVKGVSLGDVTITASTAYEGVTSKKEITITEAVIESLFVEATDDNQIITVNKTQQFNAFALFSDGSTEENIEENPDFYWDITTQVEHIFPGQAEDQPELFIDESGLLTYSTVGTYPGYTGVGAVMTVSADLVTLALPTAGLISVPKISPSQEFIGVLTSGEADLLGVKYSEIVDVEYQATGVTNYITMTHSQAITYCDDVLYNGHDDWRLPSSDELFVLWDQEDGADGVGLFGHHWIFSISYWSITEQNDEFNTVSLANGDIASAADSDFYYVSCVRAVQ